MGVFLKKVNKFVKFCPKCHSKNMSNDWSNPALVRMGVFNGGVCEDCGYAGNFFPEVDETIKLSKRDVVQERVFVNEALMKSNNKILLYLSFFSLIVTLLVMLLVREKIVFLFCLTAILPISFLDVLFRYKPILFKKYYFLKILYVLFLFNYILLSAFYFIPKILDLYIVSHMPFM
jgi:hypothetical protein